jgi:hypothetical protein
MPPEGIDVANSLRHSNYPFLMLLNEKEAISFRKEHVPLTARPLDLFYFIYFIVTMPLLSHPQTADIFS